MLKLAYDTHTGSRLKGRSFRSPLDAVDTVPAVNFVSNCTFVYLHYAMYFYMLRAFIFPHYLSLAAIWSWRLDFFF